MVVVLGPSPSQSGGPLAQQMATLVGIGIPMHNHIGSSCVHPLGGLRAVMYFDGPLAWC
jgi:hypothetical protein